MSSKRKKRHAEWLKREEKRKALKDIEERRLKALASGDFGELVRLGSVKFGF